MPSPASLIAFILFGIIGFAAWRYGKKTANNKYLYIGIALMVYPYFVAATWALYGIGAALVIGLFVL